MPTFNILDTSNDWHQLPLDLLVTFIKLIEKGGFVDFMKSESEMILFFLRKL
jgi:hypothetical protein